jgi:ATP-dependent Zn protease
VCVCVCVHVYTCIHGYIFIYAVCMGGRAAEEVIFGPDHVTSGASSDFEQATQVCGRVSE